MCGRYDLVVTGGVLAARFGIAPQEAEAELQDWQPRYNIAPSQLNPVVLIGDERAGHSDRARGRRLVRMKWGLVPSWSTEPQTSFSAINARAETITQKPAFRKLLTSRRCLVPATGYFEWAISDTSEGTGGKQPYRVQVTGGNPGTDHHEGRIVAMAGLYDVWKGAYGEDREPAGDLLTYTIITTEASPTIRGLHERMPVILSREDEQLWLDPRMNDTKQTERLLRLLRPYPDTLISAYRVGPLVNSPSKDRGELIRAA